MQKDLQSLIYSLITLILFIACGTTSEVKTTSAAISNDAAKAIIAVRNTVFSDAVAKNDSVTFVNCYTDSLCLYAPEICNKNNI